jgi:hypothetical protein
MWIDSEFCIRAMVIYDARYCKNTESTLIKMKMYKGETIHGACTTENLQFESKRRGDHYIQITCQSRDETVLFLPPHGWPCMPTEPKSGHWKSPSNDFEGRP